MLNVFPGEYENSTIYSLEVAEGVPWKEARRHVSLNVLDWSSYHTHVISDDPRYNGAFALYLRRGEYYPDAPEEGAPIVEVDPEAAVSIDTTNMYRHDPEERKRVLSQIHVEPRDEEIEVKYNKSTHAFDRKPNLDEILKQVKNKERSVLRRILKRIK